MSSASMSHVPDSLVRRRVACAHCSLPVPPALVRTDLEHQFCCHGCETVFRTIHECGLDDYYRLRDATTDARLRPEANDRTWAEFDDPAFHTVYVRHTGDNKIVELLLEHVHCAACVWLVERLAQILPGVIESRLNLRRRVVTVRWNPEQTSLSRIAMTLNNLGYRPHPARGVNAEASNRREERRMLARIAIAGFCAGNVMLLAFALYGGEIDSIEPRFEALFRWLSMIIAAVALLWPGSVFYRGALASLRARVPHLDLPIAIALSMGGLWGIFNTLRGSGEIFFDSLTVLVFLLLVGRFIQRRQQRIAGDQVELLYALTPSNARLIEPTGVRIVPLQALRTDDQIEVLPNESIAADGLVVDGASNIDTSLLTGESRPMSVEIGSRVAAGTINLSSPIRVRVSATGQDTRVARLMRLVADAAERKAPLLTLANRIALVFTSVVLMLTLLTFALWLPHGIDQAAEHAIALLIVTCPCALGLATPLAMTAAIGRAARAGIMIKGGDALERLAHPAHLVLDKTGTVTHGSLEVERWIGDESLKPIVAAIERHTAHPIARALADLSPADDTIVPANITHHRGAAIEADVLGEHFSIGSPAHVLCHTDHHEPHMTHAIDEATALGQTPVAIARGRTLVALALLADRVRSDSATIVAALKHRGWHVSMLSGDDPRVARHVASQVGIDPDHAFGGIDPEGKVRRIEQGPRPVVMIGDGVNDAAALAAADVGVAVAGGAEASLEAADVYLARPGLGPLLTTLELATSTRRTIVLCMGASLAYNAAAATLAMTGLISALLAAIIMPVSSLTVVAIASRAGARATRTASVAPSSDGPDE
jgi:Cu2+-exporting ATPase